MSESTTFESTTQQVANTVKKAFSGLGTRLETAVGELNKLQSQGLEQASALADTASRAAKEQVAFAEQVTGEWRKVLLSATRSATDLFTPKA